MGEVVGIEDKTMGGETRQYYVVRVGNLTLWTPVVDEAEGSNLRSPASRAEFQASLKIIHTPGEPLADNKYQRQSQVIQRLRKKSLDETCLIIRDLIAWSKDHRLTRDDADLLKRAEDILLDEWELSLGLSREVARVELDRLLAADPVEVV
jgi:RNA polymerase-interacting CarD/CdnL/TRCF family regulator